MKARERIRRFFERHPEKMSEYGKRYYETHREQERARLKAYAESPVGRAVIKARYEKNADKIKARSKAWVSKNRDRHNARSREYARIHPEKIRAWREAHEKNHPGRRREFAKAWNAAHPWVKTASVALRRAQKKQATPKWADLAAIRAIYKEAKIRSQQTGMKWEVDHFYPLVSDIMCGLHVPENLRVIPARENRLKGNRVVAYG